MKKLTILTFLLLFVFFQTLKAQSQNNEIYAGYGAAPLPQVYELFLFNMLIPAVTFGTYETRDYGLSGEFFAGYNYKPVKWISVGVMGGYMSSKREFTSTVNSNNKLTVTMNHLVILARGDIHYTGDNIVDLYSGISLGLWNTNSSGKTDLNSPEAKVSTSHGGFHFNLLGIKIGNQIGGFAEFGLGVNGTINLGVFGRF